METNTAVNFGRHTIPLYHLSDQDAQFVSSFLQCASDQAEVVYSAILEMSKTSNVPLGFSPRELRRLVCDMVDPVGWF